MKRLVFAAFVLFVAQASNATPASDDSIKKLLRVTQVESLVNSTYANIRPVVEGMIAKSTPEGQVREKALAVLGNKYQKIEKIMREEMSYEKVEPEYIRIYKEAFTEEEVEGMIAFYESPVGVSVMEKMPLVANSAMRIVQSRIPYVIQKVDKVLRE